MRRRYKVEEDLDPGQVPEPSMPQDGLESSETYREQSDSIGEETDSLTNHEEGRQQPIAGKKQRQNPRLPEWNEFGLHNPRRSGRSRKPPSRYRYSPFHGVFKTGGEVL